MTRRPTIGRSAAPSLGVFHLPGAVEAGRLWRRLGEQEEVVELAAGVSLTITITITTGTHFQFRGDGQEPLNALGATMPPWPGESEAIFVDGTWQLEV